MTWSAGINYSIGGVISVTAGFSVSKGGGITYSTGVSAGKWAIPFISAEAEYGRTTEKYKWKLVKVSKTIKDYKVAGFKFNVKRNSNYVRYRIQKGRVQVNAYDSGKTTVTKY